MKEDYCSPDFKFDHNNSNGNVMIELDIFLPKENLALEYQVNNPTQDRTDEMFSLHTTTSNSKKNKLTE